MPRWVIPDDWIESDGYAFVAFCVPNSRKWRGLIMGLLHQLDYGWNWDEKTGNIKDIQEVARDILETICMGCFDDLLVKFDALEAQLIQLNTNAAELSNLQRIPDEKTMQEFLDELDDSTFFGDLADIAEVFSFLRDIIPNFSPKIDVASLMTMVLEARYKASVINLMEDITISQRVQATAQYGNSGHGLFDLFSTAADKLLLPAGWLGKAVWLWQRAKPSDIPLWASWILDITGWFLGSIRGATYDIANNVEALKTVVSDQGPCQVHNYVNCGVCGTGGGGGTIEQDSGIEAGTPPEGTGPVDPLISNRKCKAANQITDDLLDTIAQLDGVDFGVFDIVDVIPASGIVGSILTGAAALIDSALGAIAGMAIDVAYQLIELGGVNFGTLHAQISSNRQAFICGMYDATTAADARDDAIAALTIGAGEETILRLLMQNNVMNLLFFSFAGSEAIIDAATQTTSCAPCAGPTCGAWTLVYGTLDAGSLADGTSGFTIGSLYASSAGCLRETLQITTPPNCCVEITHSAPSLVDKPCADGISYTMEECGGTVHNGPVYSGGTICLEPNTTIFLRSQPANPFQFIVTVNQQNCP